MSADQDFSISDLYDVASDGEADVLDDLRIRAGHIWACAACTGWRNPASESRCDNCGAARDDEIDS